MYAPFIEDFALSDDGHLFAEAPTAREPETGPRTSRFLEEIVAEERRGKLWPSE